MTNVRSWKFWVIIALALTTLACAGRRERKEQAREAKRERAEQARLDRAERNARAEQAAPATAAAPAAQTAQTTQAASFQPISTAPAAAGGPDAKIVFVRVTSFGGAIAASVFDVTESGDAKFIGIVNRKTRVEYPVKPGLHTFMIVSEAADFMQAQVVGGKTYYALVVPRPGAWKARFSLVPVRQNEQRVDTWEAEVPLVTNTSRTLDWAKKNAASVEDKRSRYWPEWSSKPEEQRLAQTLNAEDGR
jgi:hypothetical protein